MNIEVKRGKYQIYGTVATGRSKWCLVGSLTQPFILFSPVYNTLLKVPHPLHSKLHTLQMGIPIIFLLLLALLAPLFTFSTSVAVPDPEVIVQQVNEYDTYTLFSHFSYYHYESIVSTFKVYDNLLIFMLTVNAP